MRPSPDPDAYPDEPNGADEARQTSGGWTSAISRYRLVICLLFFLLIIAGSLGYLAISVGAGHILYPLLTSGVLINLVFAGILIIFLLYDAATGGLFAELRISRQRREARTAQVRAIRRRRKPSRSEEPQDPSRHPSPEVYDSLPAWLVPLLKNRPVSFSLHDEITATATTTEEAESMLQTAIDDFTPEVTTITITPDELESPPIDEHTVSDQTYEVEYPSDATIEREAILDLLGALELQYKAGRVTDRFYKRKRKQLLDRLAALS
jgi:hypothetical protein